MKTCKCKKRNGKLWGNPVVHDKKCKVMKCPKCGRKLKAISDGFYEGLYYCYEDDAYYTENLKKLL